MSEAIFAFKMREKKIMKNVFKLSRHNFSGSIQSLQIVEENKLRLQADEKKNF